MLMLDLVYYFLVLLSFLSRNIIKQLTLNFTKVVLVMFTHYHSLSNVIFFPQYPLPELVVIHQQQQSLDDVQSLETYIKQVQTELRTLWFLLRLLQM